MKEALANVFTGVLVLCALTVTGLVVRREFFPPPPAGLAERPVENWQRLAATGSVIGAKEAPLKIVSFSDFQCPFCAQVNERLERVRAVDPTRVAVVYRHFPLESIHPHAFNAAVASECAGAQGRFQAYHDALYARQDSIGVKPWDGFAEAAGVPDVAEFRKCVSEQRFREQVSRDLKEGKEIGVSGTPTFVFDGRMVSGVPAADKLDEWVRAALKKN